MALALFSHKEPCEKRELHGKLPTCRLNKVSLMVPGSMLGSIQIAGCLGGLPLLQYIAAASASDHFIFQQH